MINVEIGSLDKRIHIMQYQESTDEYGLTHQTLADAIGNAIWARIEPARGKTYYEQYKDKVEFVTKVTIRYRKGITGPVREFGFAMTSCGVPQATT